MKEMRRPECGSVFIVLCLVLLLAVPVSHAVAQNVSIYAGESKTLYDSRYYPALFGEGVAPTFPTFDVKLGWTDYGSSPYATICKHPERGIGFSFGYSGEFGLGFMFSHRYDPVENPWNVVISTPVNAHISLGFQAQYAISPRFDAGIGFFFNHHSNGAVSFPNYGLNAFELAVRLGMKAPRSEEEMHRETVDDGFKRGFFYGIQASGGIMSNEASYERHLEEEGIWVNERYFKYAFEANAFYRYCRTHATGLGFDFFVTPFCDKIAENDGRGETYDPFSYGFSLQHELRYYNFSTVVGVGRYLHHHDGLARNKAFYQLVTVKYRFPQLGNMYTGIILKAHKFKAAECIQICVGKEF